MNNIINNVHIQSADFILMFQWANLAKYWKLGRQR